MSKTVREIVSVAAAVGVFVTTGNIGLSIAAYQVTNAVTTAAFAKTPRPAQTGTALKTERPSRISGYGRNRLFGAYVLYETAEDGTAVDVWAFHEGRVDAIEGYYLGDDKVTVLSAGFVAVGEDKRYGPNPDNIQIGANLGASPGVAWPQVMAKLPGVWTSAHRGDGVVTGFMLSKPVKAKNFQTTYATGGPNQTPLAIVARLQPVFDWRDPAQSVDDPATWTWGENAILHLAHYELVRNNKTWARHFLPTLAFWTAAANDCDVAMPLKAGGTEPRYRSCVTHRHAGDGSEHKAVVAAILACCDGWMAPRQDGALVVYSGRYYPPTVTIDARQIVSYTWETGIEDESAVNEIPVTYISADHDFNAVDTDPWTDEDDISARGAVRSEQLENQVPSYAQARRLAKRKMAQDMAPKRGTCVTTSAGSVVIGQRFIMLDLTEGAGTPYAFTPYAGPVEITQLRRNLETGAVAFTWRAASAAIDEWNELTEEGRPAPMGEPVPVEPVATPTITAITVNYTDVGSGDPAVGGQTSSGARLQIDAAGPDRDDLTWFARWRVGTSGPWSENDYADTLIGTGARFLTDFVPITDALQVQVAYSLGSGQLSDWSATTTVDTKR